MAEIIKIDALNKSFGALHAVQDLSFQVETGELFAFLGVNGAGKSTTIHMMCGQLPKDSGQIVIGGVDIDDNVDAVKSKIGVVFQSSVLDQRLSVRDNLESRAALYGIVGRAFTRRLRELTELLDFADLLKRRRCPVIIYPQFIKDMRISSAGTDGSILSIKRKKRFLHLSLIRL